MVDDISDITSYYNEAIQSERSRLDRHQLEFDLTWRYFERFLPAQGSILEIGAATGRYTLGLAKRGYAITAMDLSDIELEENHNAIAEQGLDDKVSYLVADARDLSAITRQDFDAVLLMGPLYHLIEEEDRITALKQASNRLRSGGVIFSAFISRFGILGDLIKNETGWIEDLVEVRALIATGQRPEGYPKGGFRGYFALTSEIAPLHEALGFETLALAGVEPAISADDQSYNRLQGAQRQLWLETLDAVSTESSIIGASRHLLYVGKKK